MYFSEVIKVVLLRFNNTRGLALLGPTQADNGCRWSLIGMDAALVKYKCK